MANFTFAGNGTQDQNYTINPATDTLTFSANVQSVLGANLVARSADSVTIAIQVATTNTLDTDGIQTLTLTISSLTALAANPSAILFTSPNAVSDLDFVIATANGTTANTGADNDVILGSLGSETIDGGDGFNIIFGGGNQAAAADLADSLTGGSGFNLIYGNGGDDTINGGTGGGVLVGGMGADSITASPTSSSTLTIYGGGSSADTGDQSADTINIGVLGTNAGAGDVEVYGNAGNDTINVFANGAVSVFGGSGSDSIFVGANGNLSNGNNFIVAGIGADSITVFGNGNNTIGEANIAQGDGADTISVVGTGNNLIYGNTGNDQITLGVANGQLGNNTVYGGADNDTIVVNGGQFGVNGGSTSSLTVVAGLGADSVNTEAFTGNATIYGGNGLGDSVDGADTLRGGNFNDVIRGNGGNDVISTGAGADTIYGGQGIDRIIINDGAGAQALNNGVAGVSAGNKVIADIQTGEQVFVNGGTTASSYTASVTGGDVVLTTAARTITFTGGANQIINVGFDPTATTAALVTAAAAPTSVLIANFGSTAQTLQGVNNLLIAPDPSAGDRFYSGSAGDTIIGAGGADSVFAGGGNDSIDVSGGTAGNVSIVGGDGNDTVSLGTSLTNTDILDGGNGTDVLNFTGAAGGTNGLNGITNFEVINLSNATPSAPLSFTTLDTLVGANQTLTVNGGSLDVTSTLRFDGRAETDGRFSITGGAGQDTLIGGGQADSIVGGAANDFIVGNAGADSLTGGDGGDALFGGAGNDIIVLTETGLGSDNITFGNDGLNNDVTPANVGTDIVSGTFNAGAGGDILTFDISAFGLAGGTEARVTVDNTNPNQPVLTGLDANGGDEIFIIAGGGFASDQLANQAVANTVNGVDGLNAVYVYFNTSDQSAHVIFDTNSNIATADPSEAIQLLGRITGITTQAGVDALTVDNIASIA